MKIFVSYRRSDSQDVAARIVDRLNDMPGINRVFFDVDSIAPGTDFEESIKSALDQCEVCLILIGNNWRGRTDGDAVRFDDEADYVRQETASALASGKRVIPVLLNNADMPTPASLPDDSKALATLNAAFLRHHSFNQDIEVLADAIFNRKAGRAPLSLLRKHPVFFGIVKSIIGMLAAAVLLIIMAMIHKSITGNAINQSVGDGVAWLLIIVTLVAGGAAPLLQRR